MNSNIKDMLKEWADKYETHEYIKSDPVQFPHRYSKKQDVEIRAFVTSWISYGNRKAIIAKAEELEGYFAGNPQIGRAHV